MFELKVFKKLRFRDRLVWIACAKQAFRKKRKKKKTEKGMRKHREVKPLVTRSQTFSRDSCQPRVLALTFDWFTGLSLSFVLNYSNYFGFMHQQFQECPSSPGQPRGICSRFQSRGWDIRNFIAVRGLGICVPRCPTTALTY